MPIQCETCGAAFKYASLLAKHLARKTPCDREVYSCNCGRRFVQPRSLAAHRAKCGVAGAAGAAAPDDCDPAPAATVTNAINTNVTNNSTDNSNHSHNTTNYIVVGWPPAWPVPPQWPNPFSPETMTLDSDMIEQATKRLAGLGDPESTAMAAAVMDVVKILHARQAERNLYPNPTRGDQALTFAEPGQWDAIPHTEARTRLVGRVMEDLGKLGLVAGAAAAAGAAAKAAAPAFAAHLTNLGRQAAAGVDAAAAIAAPRDCRLPRDPLRTWYYGSESVVMCGNSVTDDMLESIALHLETCNRRLWGVRDDEEARAAHAVLMYDRYAFAQVPENYTAFEVGGVAQAWTHKGTRGEWRAVPPGEVARTWFIQAARAFSQNIRLGAKAGPAYRAGLCAKTRAALARVADYLTDAERDPDDPAAPGDYLSDIPTEAAEVLAMGGAARALFVRRSDLARQFYMSAPGRAGPCEVDCGCSRGVARRLIRDAL